MRSDKRSPESGPSVPAEPGDGDSRATADLATLRNDYLSQLKAIAARVQQLSAQLSSDWARAMQEAEVGLQSRRQSLATDYANKAQQAACRAGAAQEVGEMSQRCSEALEASHRDARKTFDETAAKLRAAYDSGIAEANRAWDLACRNFVDVLQQRLTDARASASRPAELADIGQSLSWIASMMRRPAAA